ESTVGGQQRVGDAQHISVPGPVAEDQCDELVVAERRHAMAQQLLARPIVRRQFFHRTTAKRILSECRRSVASCSRWTSSRPGPTRAVRSPPPAAPWTKRARS